MSKTGFTDWLHKEIKLQQQQQRIMIMAMAKNLKEHQHGAVTIDQEQKKLILDVFNAGREVFEDFDLRYVSAWDLKQLEDLIDDMKDAFGIVPKVSEYKNDDGDSMPAHFQDHVYSNNPRAWKRED
jgi:hypothetical protein